MRIYPAIDMKDGKCVRLKQGKFDEVTIYNEDPLKVALEFKEAGASYIHIVDLDGALAGKGINTDAIEAIAKALPIPIQTGGGIRDMDAIEAKLNAGVTRVILGTAAVKDPDFLQTAIKEYGGQRIVAGLDAKNGMIALEGWEEESTISAIDLGREMKKIGVKYTVYTDISRDGMLTGPNIEETVNLQKESGLTVIASGGVSSMKDLSELYNAGITGVITGKALYEGRINLKEAIALYEGGK